MSLSFKHILSTIVSIELVIISLKKLISKKIMAINYPWCDPIIFYLLYSVTLSGANIKFSILYSCG